MFVAGVVAQRLGLVERFFFGLGANVDRAGGGKKDGGASCASSEGRWDSVRELATVDFCAGLWSRSFSGSAGAGEK